MNKRYNEVMERIEVTPEMRRRILANIQSADLTKKASANVVRFPRVRQFAALAACLAVVLAGSLTLPHLFQGPDDLGALTAEGGIVQVDSVEELSDHVGFEVAGISGLPFQPKEVTYTAYWKELAEIVYSGEGRTAVYRQGSGKEDVSGDYNLYAAQTSLTLNGLTVALKGDSQGYTLATWTDGTFSYSLCLSDALTEAEWRAMLAAQT